MYLLLDIGGTNTRVGISQDGINLQDYKTYSTPQNYQEGLERLEHTARLLLGSNIVSSLAAGVPGALNQDKSEFSHREKLLDWVGKPFKTDLEKIFQTKVLLENDAALAGLGEILSLNEIPKIGAYITVSTGIGGVRIVNGKIDANLEGFEPGHQLINFFKKPNGEITNVIEWESLISGKALEKRFGFKPEEILEPRIWEEITEILSIGIVNTILFWSPEVIILGGAVMKSIELDRVEFYLKKYLKIFNKMPELKKAKLGDKGGLIGGLIYLKTLPIG